MSRNEKLEQYKKDYENKKRSKVVQTAIDELGLESYVEIGVNKGASFNDITCDEKVGVDPEKKVGGVLEMTSDTFFSTLDRAYDCFFIDGLHLSGQVSKDIKNALVNVSDNGVVFVHDCNPPVEWITPRERGDLTVWTGDVYKGYLRTVYELGVEYMTVDVDFGVGVIRPNFFFELGVNGVPQDKVMDAINDWNTFDDNRDKILNLGTFEKYLEFLQGGY